MKKFWISFLASIFFVAGIIVLLTILIGFLHIVLFIATFFVLGLLIFKLTTYIIKYLIKNCKDGKEQSIIDNNYVNIRFNN